MGTPRRPRGGGALGEQSIDLDGDAERRESLGHGTHTVTAVATLGDKKRVEPWRVNCEEIPEDVNVTSVADRRDFDARK
jgi:hypothetical protein|tara:strand:+ start:3652 stop:3888 length:237 start_codon:yes stop_codon:yes gene_type:complete